MSQPSVTNRHQLGDDLLRTRVCLHVLTVHPRFARSSAVARHAFSFERRFRVNESSQRPARRFLAPRSRIHLSRRNLRRVLRANPVNRNRRFGPGTYVTNRTGNMGDTFCKDVKPVGHPWKETSPMNEGTDRVIGDRPGRRGATSDGGDAPPDGGDAHFGPASLRQFLQEVCGEAAPAVTNPEPAAPW